MSPESRRISYGDDYNPAGQPNVTLKVSARKRQRRVYADNPEYSGQLHGYLCDSLRESPRVISIANEILARMAISGAAAARSESGGRAFMIGVLEDIDGHIRIANSGGKSGELDEIVKDLQAVAAKMRRAQKRNVAVEGGRDPDPLGQVEERLLGAPTWTTSTHGGPGTGVDGPDYRSVPPVVFEPFERYLKQKVGILKEHVQCAAPRLLWSAMTGDGPGLLGASMTEVWWDPSGINPVMIDGIRYHHMQRVPSCERCVQNLRVVVNGALRNEIAEKITSRAAEPGLVVEQASAKFPDGLGQVAKVLDTVEEAVRGNLFEDNNRSLGDMLMDDLHADLRTSLMVRLTLLPPRAGKGAHGVTLVPPSPKLLAEQQKHRRADLDLWGRRLQALAVELHTRRRLLPSVNRDKLNGAAQQLAKTGKALVMQNS